nr:MAG TPA: hypothetical protein [Caudoviricetes sp.]
MKIIRQRTILITVLTEKKIYRIQDMLEANILLKSTILKQR